LTNVRQRKITKLAEVRVLKRKDITADLLVMWFEKPDGFTFKPGQYCTIGRDGIERAYSIVSAPHEEDLELFFELVPLPEGVLTPKIWELAPGDTVSIRPRAKGVFILKPDRTNQLMVSTVTGVVPYVSIVREYLRRDLRGNRFYMLHGASYQNEFTYKDEMEKLAREHPELLTYVPTVSRPDEALNEGWTGETGRVNQIVERYVEELGLTPEDTIVYVCGHPGMIEDVKGQLTPRGFQVEEERFWKQD
jgi:ferredoxin--NADP+ reductase